MKPYLSQTQRIVVALIYLALLVVLFELIGGSFSALIWNVSLDQSIWFYSGAFMIILGTYVVEPFFTKPSDAVANSTAVLVALLGLNHKSAFWGYSFVFWYSATVLSLSILAIALKDMRGPVLRRIARTAYWAVETCGASKVIFSLVYLLAAYSYLSDRLPAFIGVIAFWICIVFFDLIGITVSQISKLVRYWSHRAGDELGQAIGCDNPLLYNIEIDFLKHRPKAVDYGTLVAVETSPNVGSIGMVVNRRVLLNKQWLRIYLLQDEDREILKIDLRQRKLITAPKTIFTTANLVFALDPAELSTEARAKVESHPLYRDRELFVGCVGHDSNINTVTFSILRDENVPTRRITEGVILKTPIYGDETLYQVINGNTKQERLENLDTHGFTVGIARKLGRYNPGTEELNTIKWMPNIYAPLFFAFSGSVSPERAKEIAQKAIGRLPETDLQIPIKDIDAIVTHNTAILGILGIGKSCLAFELIKKILAAGVKVFCIDITNQYCSPAGLFGYVAEADIQNDLSTEVLRTLKASKESKNKAIEGNPQASGNGGDYMAALDADIKAFLEGDAKVKVYNPDWHPVSKGVAFKNTTLEDLTIAEKTRVIAERIFAFARSAGVSDKAKYLLVFEEAHSLVPEWNSVSSDGDKNATNGTAKVILQGRKYGLGSLIVTQRTANVSKSILNQCNTIFALRVFDDTGKSFLENYIGRDYADTLPTLEERHAIAIGKGLRLKQPVILQLNDRSDVV